MMMVPGRSAVRNLTVRRQWQVQAYPSYYVLDSEHRIERRDIGYSTQLGLWLRAWLAPDPVEALDITPDVDLVICAHNEAGVIRERLENALALDYPAENLTIWVASDGSTDGTRELLNELQRQHAGRVEWFSGDNVGPQASFLPA